MPMSDTELLDHLAASAPGVFLRLARRYRWEHATPELVRAAIEVELPSGDLRDIPVPAPVGRE